MTPGWRTLTFPAMPTKCVPGSSVTRCCRTPLISPETRPFSSSCRSRRCRSSRTGCEGRSSKCEGRSAHFQLTSTFNLRTWNFLQTRQREERIGRCVLANLSRKHLAQHGSHLEPVAAAAAGNPDVRHGRMTVDDEVAVGTLFVLAHLGTDNWRVA